MPEAESIPTPEVPSEMPIDKTSAGRYTTLTKEQITPPEDPNSPFPQENDVVKVHYTGTLASNNVEFDSSRKRGRLFEFTLGVGQVIQGWDEGFKMLQKGERALLKVPAAMAYGENSPSPNIPNDADLNFDVELVSFGPKQKDKCEMQDAELLSESKLAKEQGNECFKKGKYHEAIDFYKVVLDYLEDQHSWEDSESEGNYKTDRHDLMLSVYLNTAQCYIKLYDFGHGLNSAFSALELNNKNEKALFRFCLCALNLEEFDVCKQKLKYWLTEVNPKSNEARTIHTDLQKGITEFKKKQKGTFGKLFNKTLYNEKAGISAVVPKVIEECDKVYFDIKFTPSESEESVTGRVTFALYQKHVPKTAENFKQLCIGKDEKLSYKNSIFHRVIPEFMMQGGDFTNHNGTGGLSIYGEKFDDENLTTESDHNRPYLLSMANAGPNTNGSQFFITFKEAPHLNGKHVVFGEAIDGFEWIDKAEGWSMGANDMPEGKIEIVDCGEVEVESCKKGCCPGSCE